MTPAQASDVGSRLIHLLTQQRLLYRQLQQLAAKQSELVDGNDPEMLLRLLGGRQRLIDRLAGIDRELEPIRRDWQEVAQALPAAQRDEALGLVASVQEILGEILARDERDTRTLQGQQQRVAGEIRGATTGKRMNQAYAQSAGTGQSRFLDTCSG
jgi:hypothetical protein